MPIRKLKRLFQRVHIFFFKKKYYDVFLFQNYRVNQEAARARAYLEAHVNEMTSLYDLAITSYALAKSGSSLGAVAFSKLDKFAILKGKYI